jgi:hypothetical protein
VPRLDPTKFGLKVLRVCGLFKHSAVLQTEIWVQQRKRSHVMDTENTKQNKKEAKESEVGFP